MNKKQWLAKLHELAFEDTRLDKIPFACFEPLAEGIAKLEAAEQLRAADLAEPIRTDCVITPKAIRAITAES